MATQPAGRVALMSIRPEFAEQILAGSKHVEFRKRALAPDVTDVVIYASAPVSAVIGAFRVGGQDIRPPLELWDRFAAVGGISRERYVEYFRGSEVAIGIRVEEVRVATVPVELRELGLSRPPQSFQYITQSGAESLLQSMRPAADVLANGSGAHY